MFLKNGSQLQCIGEAFAENLDQHRLESAEKFKISKSLKIPPGSPFEDMTNIMIQQKNVNTNSENVRNALEKFVMKFVQCFCIKV